MHITIEDNKVIVNLGEIGSGQYTQTWNGKDESDSPLASGLYLVRISADAESQTKKVLLLK